MSTRFVNIDRETPLLFPVDLREWLPENHSAHFIADAAEMLDIQTFKINRSGSGGGQYPPSMTAGTVNLLLHNPADAAAGNRGGGVYGRGGAVYMREPRAP
jgi:hypothetical protein